MITYDQFLETLRGARSRGHTPFLHGRSVLICTDRPKSFGEMRVLQPTVEDVKRECCVPRIRGDILSALGLKEVKYGAQRRRARRTKH